MSIVIPAGQSRTGISLPDARSRHRGQHLRRSWPLAAATLASFWAVTVVSGAVAWLAGERDAAWSKATDSRQLIDDAAAGAADRTLLVWRAGWVVLGIAVLLVATWTYTLARNARARGVPGVQPARTAAAWLVPLLGPPTAIRHIGRFVREFDYSERRLWFWLFGFYVHTAVVLVSQVVVIVGFHTTIDDPSSLGVLRRQTQVLWLEAAMSLVLTLLAMRAILHADRAVSGVQRGTARRDEH